MVLELVDRGTKRRMHDAGEGAKCERVIEELSRLRAVEAGRDLGHDHSATEHDRSIKELVLYLS
jgi:hypothetical protein